MKFFEKKKISKILQESRKVSAKTDKNSTTELLFACRGNYLVYHLYLYPQIKNVYLAISVISGILVSNHRNTLKYLKYLKYVKKVNYVWNCGSTDDLSL